MLLYVILAFLANYGHTAPYYSEDDSKVTVFHKISMLFTQKEGLNKFPNSKRTFTIPSTEETNQFSHLVRSKNTNELNKAFLGLDSLLEGLGVNSLLEGLLSPLLSKVPIDNPDGGCEDSNCNTSGESNVNSHDSSFEDSKSDADTVKNSCGPCGSEAVEESSKDIDANQEPLLLDVDLDLLTGIQSLPTNTLDQVSGVLSGDPESKNSPTNSASTESSTQCLACNSSPSSSSIQDDRASTEVGDESGGLIRIDSDILRSNSLLGHKFIITKDNSNRNIKRNKRQESDEKENKDRNIKQLDILPEKNDVQSKSSAAIHKNKNVLEETSEAMEKSEVLEIKVNDNTDLFSSTQKEKSSFNDEEISQKETIIESTDLSMNKESINQVLDETSESRGTTAIRDNDWELGVSSKTIVNSAEDNHLDNSKSSYRGSEFQESSIYDDYENTHNSISSNNYDSNFVYEFQETKKESSYDVSARQLTTGTADENDDDYFDNKMVENEMLGTEEHGIELDKSQIADGKSNTGTIQGNNGNPEIVKNTKNSEDDQYDNRAMGVESITNTVTEEHKSFDENSNQNSNGFADSQSNGFESGDSDSGTESGTSKENDGKSSKSEDNQENELIESATPTNEEEGFNSVTQNSLKDGSFTKLHDQPFKGLWPVIFRNKLFSLLQRQTLPEVPSLPSNRLRRPQTPLYNRFPQSIAGSDLYGSYAYANVGPVPNTGYGSSGMEYEQGINGEGEEVPNDYEELEGR